MKQSTFEAAARSPDWLIRPFGASKVAPAWLGLGLAIAYPLFVWLVHVIAIAIFGPVELPHGPVNYGLNVVVNGVLIGLLLAGHAHLHLGAISDLHQLRPLLPESDDDFARLLRDLPNQPQMRRWLFTIGGMCGGFAVATLDPNLQGLHSGFARTDPRYIAYLTQNIVFAALLARLLAAEIHMTRSYARLGERVEVDLLDLSKVLVFARKGLRSVVVWVLISSAFSMFWVLDSAGQVNIVLSAVVLVLVPVALVAPTLGIHRSIRVAKTNELALLAEAIRSERASALTPRRADAPPEDARLGNLIQYQAFIKAIREWPFDLSIVSRALLLIVLGTGSWLGGAVVERLLNALLD